jgi:hypothetical protein
MEMKFETPRTELRPIEPTFGNPANDEPQPRVDNVNVAVTYGVHHGRYAIGGMTVGEARRRLTPVLNIDPTAVAVIAGLPVPDEQRIEDVSMLAFVKPSAMKG